MGLHIDKLVVATNENDILDRFWKSGYYEKKPVHGQEANGGLVDDGVKAHEHGVRETYSPAMDILVSSNFERLLWFLAVQVYGEGTLDQRRKMAGDMVKGWLIELKSDGGFGVQPELLKAAKVDFESERVSDQETLATIRSIYSLKTTIAKAGVSTDSTSTSSHGGYVLDPHSAIGVAASQRSLQRAPPPEAYHISLATAHPAKFSSAVRLALKDEKDFNFEDVLPDQLKVLEKMSRRVTTVKKGDGLEGLRSLIRSRVPSK